MNNFYRHITVIALTIGAIGFMLLCFVAYKLFTLDSKVSTLNETVSGWDKYLNE